MKKQIKAARENVDPGWWPILDKYISQLLAIDPNCELLVKEKYGTLRIRTVSQNHARNEFRDIEISAERASETICEICGAPGTLRPQLTWMQTLCDRCANLDSNARRRLRCELAKQYELGGSNLEILRPDIAAQWHPTKNAPLIPNQVAVHSGKRVYWMCENGHEWQTAISHRTSGKPTNCPYCSGRKAIPGKTDLATICPKLMREWDWSLNQDLDPTKLRPRSNKRAHWRCENGHRWIATINSRVSGKGCPYCHGRYAIPGKTDLQTRYPTIAQEWDVENNGNLTPSVVPAASNRKAAWICARGHRWEATVASRTCQGNNCPICNGRKPDTGVNDLATLRPDIVLDWSAEDNEGKRPQEYRTHSSAIIVWRCHECGTTWKKSIYARVKGNKCPTCYRRLLKRK